MVDAVYGICKGKCPYEEKNMDRCPKCKGPLWSDQDGYDECKNPDCRWNEYAATHSSTSKGAKRKFSTVRNPKQVGTNLWDCIPQIGPCSMNCNQCFYNRPGAFYVPIDKPHIPDPKEVGSGIVKMNCGHDSNIKRKKVIETAKRYKNYFFNTSIPKLDFPGPVVFTANHDEEICSFDAKKMHWLDLPSNVMFVRLRVSPTNVNTVMMMAADITGQHIPVVLTFMAYYDMKPPTTPDEASWYAWRKRHINEYWCPTREFKLHVLTFMRGHLSRAAMRLLTMCGTLDSNYCKDCGNCEHHYWITKRLLAEAAEYRRALIGSSIKRWCSRGFL